MITTREVAKAVHIGTRTRRFVLRDENGRPHEGNRTLLVLAALARSDHNEITDDTRRRRVMTVAYALHKCMASGRMPATTEWRLRYQRTPYQVCALVARICRECPETTIGGICDTWLIANHASL